MMEYERPDAELRRLVSALCEGTITEREYERLERLVADDPDARRFYYDYVSLHAELTWTQVASLSGSVPSDSDKNVVQSSSDKTESQEVSAQTPVLGFLGQGDNDQVMECPQEHRSTGNYFLWSCMLVLVGGTLCLWFMLDRSHRAKVADKDVFPPSVTNEVTTPHVAHLVETVDCKWSQGCKSFIDQSALAAGETIKFDAGLAKIAFDGCAEIILEGPAEFHIESAMSAKLLRGRLSAKVTNKGHGFTVFGPKMRVLDLGTEFGLAVDEDGEGQVHVFKGEVEVSLLRGDGRAIRSELVTENRAAVLDTKDGKIDPVQLDPSEFIRTFEVPGLDITREYVQSVKTLKPVAYWRFEYFDDGRVLNEMSDRYHGHSPTRLVLSRDVQNKTLSVDQRRDNKQYMVINEPLTELANHDVTIEFWINPDGYQWTTPVTLFESKLDRQGNELVAGLVELLPAQRPEHDQPTRVVRLLHRLPASYVFDEGVNCYSNKEYKPGKWHHVVSVYDGKQMRLYLNGEQVASTAIVGRIDFAPCISIGRPPGPMPVERREVNKEMLGQIDEVAVYNRALTAAQIAEHYRLGMRNTAEQ